MDETIEESPFLVIGKYDRPKTGPVDIPVLAQDWGKVHEGSRASSIGPEDDRRIIDLVAPVGRGQRGLIVSPPKAGKTKPQSALETSKEALRKRSRAAFFQNAF